MTKGVVDSCKNHPWLSVITAALLGLAAWGGKELISDRSSLAVHTSRLDSHDEQIHELKETLTRMDGKLDRLIERR